MILGVLLGVLLGYGVVRRASRLPLVCSTRKHSYLGYCSPHAALRQPVARLVAVEGASTTYGLKDYNGQVVTAVVPSQSSADIQGQSTADQATNQVKVVTRAGQILVLEMAPEALRGMQIGDTFQLVFPRKPRRNRRGIARQHMVHEGENCVIGPSGEKDDPTLKI